MDWKDRQIPAFYDHDMINLQKEFATQLLDRVNPYTGLSYKTDPAIAIVEIVNEQGLLHAWRDGKLETLPGTFSNSLRSSWNQFLQGKYANQAQLAQAWTRTSPAGNQLLLNRNFASQLQNWTVEQHNGAAVSSRVSKEGPSGTASARLQVTTPSATDWHVQFNQPNLSVSADTVYSLSFWAKADRAKTISVSILQAHDPWGGLGFQKSIALTTHWQKFSFTLNLSSSDSNARLDFMGLGDQPATYWFADFSLAPGGTIGLFPEENLEQGSIRLFVRDEQGERLDLANRDFAEFLWNKEESYWREMRDHLKTTLGIQALLMGTVVGNSTPNLMALFDIVDSHSYWQHPAFEVSWGSPWWIRNSSVLGERDGGTLSGLAIKRVQGKPFSVSEYNHPFPNSFGVEALPLLAAYGALQDWDAIFGYTYADGTLNWEEDRQVGYFDLQHDPGKMISLLSAAALFRRGDVGAARQLVTVSMNKEDEIRLMPAASSWRLVDAEYQGLDRRIALLHRVALVTGNGVRPPGALEPAVVTLPADDHYRADQGQLEWDAASKVLQVSTPASKAVIGYAMGKTYSLDGFQFRPQSALMNWAAVQLIAVAPPARAPQARRFLLTALGLVQNQGLEWKYYPDNRPAGFPPPADTNLTLGSWGTAPVQAEGIQAELTVPFPAGWVQVFSLDPAGNRKGPVPVSDAGGTARFQISDSYATLWYEILVNPPRPRQRLRDR
jgi:hypothetical protein